jgi:hypothetical protein
MDEGIRSLNEEPPIGWEELDQHIVSRRAAEDVDQWIDRVGEDYALFFASRPKIVE